MCGTGGLAPSNAEPDMQSHRDSDAAIGRELKQAIVDDAIAAAEERGAAAMLERCVAVAERHEESWSRATEQRGQARFIEARLIGIELRALAPQPPCGARVGHRRATMTVKITRGEDLCPALPFNLETEGLGVEFDHWRTAASMVCAHCRAGHAVRRRSIDLGFYHVVQGEPFPDCDAQEIWKAIEQRYGDTRQRNQPKSDQHDTLLRIVTDVRGALERAGMTADHGNLVQRIEQLASERSSARLALVAHRRSEAADAAELVRTRDDQSEEMERCLRAQVKQLQQQLRETTEASVAKISELQRKIDDVLIDVRPEFRRRFHALEEMVELAKSPGNADANEYLRGMANGLILADHVIHKRDGDPPYVEALRKEADV